MLANSGAYLELLEQQMVDNDTNTLLELGTGFAFMGRQYHFEVAGEDFILFDHSGPTVAKILVRNHQYLGMNEAVISYVNRDIREGKLGVFWHTYLQKARLSLNA